MRTPEDWDEREDGIGVYRHEGLAIQYKICRGRPQTRHEPREEDEIDIISIEMDGMFDSRDSDISEIVTALESATGLAIYEALMEHLYEQ